MRRLAMAALGAAVLLSPAHGGKFRNETVGAAMKQGHRGKDSPFHRLIGGKNVRDEANKDLSWEELGKIAASLGEVSDVLAKNRDFKSDNEQHWKLGVDYYGKGVKDLAAAVKAKDRKAVDKATSALHLSCVDCHHYYSPGFGR